MNRWQRLIPAFKVILGFGLHFSGLHVHLLSTVQVSSFGDVFCQSYEVDLSEGMMRRDTTCSAGVASDNISLSDEVFNSVCHWLDKAELQLSAATATTVVAGDDFTCHNVQPLFNGLC